MNFHVENMMRVKPVYLPHNEPYLGRPKLRAFDEGIPDAMRTNVAVASRTFNVTLNSLQIAAAEIIPQGVSIALSIRELIRQAYLYSAAILIRPLVERTGTISYLQTHPNALADWQAGWPRHSQPSFQQLLAMMHPSASPDTQKAVRIIMHKLVHSDPAGSAFNMFRREDGVQVFSSGKIVDQPEMCDFIASAAHHYLDRLISVAIQIFPEDT